MYFNTMDFDLSVMQKNWEKITNDVYMDTTDKLGKGSYGQVFKGYSRKCKSFIAIKCIKLAGKPLSDERQIQTLKILSSLKHDNIMGYYDYEIKGSNGYIFTEYCNKGTLRNLIKKRISEVQVLRLLRQLVEGMCYINAKGQMHRDLKPQNILISQQNNINNIKISDFGLAQSSSSLFVTGQLGTIPYVAPQVYLQKTYTNKCDVWSAGMILYEMLTGQILLKGRDVKQQLKEEWMMFKRGLKKAEYGSQFYPLWQYFTNWMLIFDQRKRPTFHDVLQKLKIVQDKMKIQIENGNGMKKTSELQKLDAFLSFQFQKYQLFLDLFTVITFQEIRICNEFKYLIMFLCILRYLIFTKKFVRDLKYRRIKYKQTDLISNYQDACVQMVIDKYRFIIENRLQFYNEQIIKTIIVDRILNTYCKRKESIDMMKELGNILKMVKQFDEGYMGFSQKTCADAMRFMLPIIQKHYRNTMKSYTIDELRIYLNILILMCIDDKLPVQKFTETNLVKNCMQKIRLSTKQELIKETEILRKQIFQSLNI